MTYRPLQEYRTTKQKLDVLTELIDADEALKARSIVERVKRMVGADYLDFTVADHRAGTMDMRLEDNHRSHKAAANEYLDRELYLIDPISKKMAGNRKILFARDVLDDAKKTSMRREAHLIEDVFGRHDIQCHCAVSIELAKSGSVGALFAGVVGSTDKDAFRKRLVSHDAYFRLIAMAYFATFSASGAAPGRGVLSLAEAEVLRHLAGGMSQPEIAEATGKSPSTIRNQIATAKTRLGAKTALQAAVIAVDLGLIRTPRP